MTAVSQLLLVMLLLVSGLGGCTRTPEPEDVVARVGNAVLSESDLRAALPVGSMLGGPGHAADARRQLIERWVDRELLYQEALARGMHRQPRLRTLIEEAERDLLAAALLDAEFGGQEADIEETDVQRYYHENRADFQRASSEVRARHILLASRRDANARLQALQRSASFEELAGEFSLDPDTRFRGGDLGYFSQEEEPVLWAACEDLSLYEVSQPIRTDYGYHLIEVLDRQEAGTVREIEQIRDRIVEALVRQRQQEQLNRLLHRLREQHQWSMAPEPTDND